MHTVLDHDAVLAALDRDIRQYPENSDDYAELARIRELLLRARENGDTVHLVSVGETRQ